jgi:hypothetical protein
MTHTWRKPVAAVARRVNEYFCSLRYWPWDVVGCFFLAAVVTPAEPYSLLWFVPIAIAWLAFRFVLTHCLRNTETARAMRAREETASPDR